MSIVCVCLRRVFLFSEMTFDTVANIISLRTPAKLGSLSAYVHLNQPTTDVSRVSGIV